MNNVPFRVVKSYEEDIPDLGPSGLKMTTTVLNPLSESGLYGSMHLRSCTPDVFVELDPTKKYYVSIIEAPDGDFPLDEK